MFGMVLVMLLNYHVLNFELLADFWLMLFTLNYLKLRLEILNLRHVETVTR